LTKPPLLVSFAIVFSLPESIKVYIYLLLFI
jgi:hypothetical protein